MLSWIAVWFVSHDSASGATIVVTIHEQVPGTATGLQVGIRPSLGDSALGDARFCDPPDANRLARCVDLPVGGYQLGLYTADGLELVPITTHQRRVRGLISVGDSNDLLDAQLWVPAGHRYRVAPPKNRTESVTLKLESELEWAAATFPDPLRPFEIVVPPGRWELRLGGFSGPELTQVVLDGSPLHGPPFMLTVPPGFGFHQLELVNAKPGRITGVVRSATLTRPVVVFAESRGEVRSAGAHSELDPEGRFSLDLPAGRWEFRLISPCTLETDRQTVEVGSGETRQIEIRVLKESCEPTRAVAAITVEIALPAGRKFGSVELLLESVDLERFFRTGETLQPVGDTVEHRFASVFAGNYVLWVRGHGFVETKVEVKDLEAGQHRRIVVRPERSASVVLIGDFRAAKHPIEAYATLDRLATGDNTDETQQQRTGFDLAARAGFSQLPPGTYRLNLELELDPRENLVAAFLDDSGGTSESVEFTLEAAELHTFRVTLEPAAEVQAVVRCDDGSPIEGAIDLFVTLADEPLPETPRRQLFSNPAVKWHPLRQGETQARPPYAAGLRPGRAHLMFSPAQFERVYYLSGSDSSESSPITTLLGGESLDLGYVAIDCAPAVRVSVEIPGDKSIDHHEFGMTARGQLTSGESIDIQVNARGSHQSLSLKSRIQELELTVTHPYLIPSRLSQRVAIDPNAARGSIVPVEIHGGTWGGRIEFEDRTLIGRARRTGEEEVFSIPGVLPPGRYQLQICTDSSCKRVRGEKRTIEVSARQTAMLR